MDLSIAPSFSKQKRYELIKNKLKKSCHDTFRKIDLLTLPYISEVACAVNKIANWFRKYLYTMLVRQEVEEPRGSEAEQVVFSLSYLSYSCI